MGRVPAGELRGDKSPAGAQAAHAAERSQSLLRRQVSREQLGALVLGRHGLRFSFGRPQGITGVPGWEAPLRQVLRGGQEDAG